MIQLTRLNNSRLAVNCDLIKFVEQAPDTVITLINGEKLVVRETTEQVIEAVRNFRRSFSTTLSGEPHNVGCETPPAAPSLCALSPGEPRRG